jgi:heme-degrading monooxygenase HmoA
MKSKKLFAVVLGSLIVLALSLPVMAQSNTQSSTTTTPDSRPQKKGMIFEMAQIEIKPGMESAFENGVAQAVPLFQRAPGCRGVQLLKSIEQPSRYTLMVTWESVDAHTHFRESQDFPEWRRLVGGLFASPPQVGHVQVALTGF